MAFDKTNLCVAAHVNGFTLWHYVTEDPAATVAKEGYFDEASDLLRVGDIIFAHTDANHVQDVRMLSVCHVVSCAVYVRDLTGGDGAVADEHWRAADRDPERRPARLVRSDLAFEYVNHAGEIGTRSVIPVQLWFGRSPHHEGERWFLRAFDRERQAQRDFALDCMTAMRPANIDPETDRPDSVAAVVLHAHRADKRAEELASALAPFARYAQHVTANLPADADRSAAHAVEVTPGQPEITVGDLLRAAQVLPTSAENGQPAGQDAYVLYEALQECAGWLSAIAGGSSNSGIQEALSNARNALDSTSLTRNGGPAEHHAPATGDGGQDLESQKDALLRELADETPLYPYWDVHRSLRYFRERARDLVARMDHAGGEPAEAG